MADTSPRGLAYRDLTAAAVGGVHIDDATRPKGAHRFSVNVVDGCVRAGSVYDDVLGAVGGTVPPNGIYSFRTLTGESYKIVLSLNASDSGGTVSIIRGSRVIATATMSTGIGSTSFTSRRPVLWAEQGNRVIFTGPTEGRIFIVDFGTDGIPTLRVAAAYDRVVNAAAASGDGPYRLWPPLALALTVHQGALVVVGEDGVVYFSDPYDPDGWPLNNFFFLGDGYRRGKTVAAASVSEGRLFIGQQTGIWDVQGLLADLATTTVARRAAAGVGPIAPASVQVFSNGKVMFLAPCGPVMWSPGTYIAGSGELRFFDREIGALFSTRHADDLDIERYRPLASHMVGAISRYSAAEQVYELAMGAIVESGDNPEDRRLRLRYHVPSDRWSVHVCPPTRGMCIAHTHHDDGRPMRADSAGRLFFEGVGDTDQIGGATLEAPPNNLLISGRLQLPFVDGTPERLDVRTLYLDMHRDNTGAVEVAVLPDTHSTESEVVVSFAPVPQGETRDLAFSSDGSTDGYALGTDAIESQQSVTVRRGLPPIAHGRRVRMEIRTPAGSTAGTRWGISRAVAELGGGGRTP